MEQKPKFSVNCMVEEKYYRYKESKEITWVDIIIMGVDWHMNKDKYVNAQKEKDEQIEKMSKANEALQNHIFLLNTKIEELEKAKGGQDGGN